MTMIVREASVFHRTRSRAETAIFVIDCYTKQCVHYESAEKASDARKIFLDLEIFQEHNQLEVRHDLIDCQIDICSPEVPALFSENFDYQDIRTDFVHGILTSDILGKKIFCSLLSEGYASRVRNYLTYDAITKDIINRWTYPLVPDLNFDQFQDYEYRRHNIYKEKTVLIDPESHIDSNSIIGFKTEVAEGTIIKASVIGKHCKIKENVSVSSAYLFDNVSVGSNTIVEQAILADDVSIGANCIIAPGSVLGKGVKIPDNTKLPKSCKLSCHKSDQDYNIVSSLEGHEGNDTMDSFLGIDGLACISEEEQDFSDDGICLDKSAKKFFDKARYSLIKDFHQLGLSDSTISSDSDSEIETIMSLRSRANSVSGINIDEILSSTFVSEITQSLQRAFDENHSIENALLEVNTLRMAENASYNLVRLALVHITLQLVSQSASSQSITAILSGFLKRWGSLLRKFLFSEDDQRDLLQSLQIICSSCKEYMRYFGLFLQSFYNYDIVDENGVMLWYNSPQSQEGTSEFVRLRVEKGAQMVKWLNEAEEDSDEDES